jgi:type I restriction enzyme S subunit
MIKYRLGDIVDVISEREDNPSNCKYDKFVGLEHYISGEVEIKNYGTTDLLASAMKVFNAGDILVARRNVYLKRASVVNFDGITSGDSIVLRAKDELIKKLLPFVLNTDNFWEYAEKFSDGTMSKRLSPKILLEYEFNLPDIKEQEKLAELLWAANDTKESYKKLLALTDELVKAQFIEMFGGEHNGAVFIRLEECCVSISGGGTPSMQHPEYYGGEIPFIKSGDIKDSTVSFGALTLTTAAIENTTARLLPAGCVLLVIRSAILRHELPLAVSLNPVVINQDLKAFQPKPEFDEYYLYWAIKSNETNLLMKVQTMLTSHIEFRDILNLPVRMAPMSQQKQFRDFIEQTDKSKFELQQTILSLENTVKSLMKQYIG